MIAMFKNLDKNAIAKFNELIEELNEKNDILEKQENLLIIEKKRNLELKELITKQEEKCKALDKELVESKETNTSLKSANVALQDELICLNKSLELQFDTFLSNASTSQHDSSTSLSIAQSCIRCKDIDVDACATNVKLIESLKVKITSLESEAQQKKKDLEEEKLKYARGAYLNSRRPNIKDGIGFQRFEKHNARIKINGHEFPKFVREATNGKIASGTGHPRVPGGQSARPGGQSARTQRTVRQERSGGRISAFRLTSSNASKLPTNHFYDFNASYVIMRNKFGRVFAKYVGPHHKSPKTCVWVPKSLVTNVRGPKQVWVPKNKV
jgi:hypothetical protein